MAQVKHETKTIITDTDGSVKTLKTSKTVTYTASEGVREFVVAAAATKIVWDPVTDGSEACSTFTFLYIVSNVDDVDVEFVTDLGDEVGNEAGTVRLKADAPLVLTADDSYADVTGVDALGTGTLDVIDKIRIENNNAASAIVKVFICS